MELRLTLGIRYTIRTLALQRGRSVWPVEFDDAGLLDLWWKGAWLWKGRAGNFSCSYIMLAIGRYKLAFFFLFSSSGKGWGFVPVHYLDTRSDQASAHVTTRSSRSSHVLFLLSFQSNSAPNQITLPLTLPLLLHALPQPTSSLKRDIELIDQRNPRGPPCIPLSIRQTRDVRIPDNVHRVVEAVGWPGGRAVGFLSGPIVGRAGGDEGGPCLGPGGVVSGWLGRWGCGEVEQMLGWEEREEREEGREWDYIRSAREKKEAGLPVKGSGAAGA